VRTQKNEVNWITSRFICVGYYPLVAISKVPITDEFDKLLNGKISFTEIPDHKVILEEVLIALRKRLVYLF
jgi:hypothetical protein